MESVLVFPHQLFENHPGFKKERPILLIEDARFFSAFRFHQKKLIFHRATLKNFEKYLKKKRYKTHYVEGELKDMLKQMHVSTLYVTELDDSELEKTLRSLVKRLKIQLVILPSPGFMTTTEDFQDLYRGKSHFAFEKFYIHQRKRLNLLLDEKGKPLGGKWSTDRENRKRVPKSLKIPQPPQFPMTREVKEAIAYVKKQYPDNPGNADFFNYPTTHADAKKALDDFLEKRLHLFGDYEDAILHKEQILFHSCLSPLLNVGLLTPDQVIKQTLNYCQKHQVPLNSLEGFVRQVVGWREFIRGIYQLHGEKQRQGNFFKHKRQLPNSFYQGTTGILPVDESIKKLQKYAYLHHIERLMILGNFFLICEIAPHEIYRWFMELFIDAYDWVMVPNVYGMSQYADGGTMTTKPYFSSSNYLLKMGDYPKGDWCKIWDALFWRFMVKNSKFFEKQPRLSVLCKLAKKKKKETALLKIAETFLKGLQ